MMNAGNQKGKTRQTSDWRRRMIAFVSALTLLISSCGLTAFAESDEDIYSNPVTAPIPAANTSPEPEEGEAEATPAPEGQPETGTEPQEAAGEGTEPEGEPEVSEEPEDLTVYEPGTLTAEADGVGITVDYTAEARVPEGTVLTLTRAAGGDLYTALKSAAKVLKTEEDATWKRELGEDAVFYAISLTNSEGNEVHPETGVTLTCTNLEIPANATGFVTGENAENLDWKDTFTVGFLPDAIGYAYLKQVQIGTVTLTHEDRDYMVTAAYGPDAGFPADIELKVREILPGTPEYALYSGMTDEALNEDWAEITLERYFDIAFVANGEELEPKADVDVQIVFRDKIEQNEETEVAAVHIENNEANVIEAETDSTKSARHDDEAIDTVTFTSDSFSVYGVVQKKKITQKVLAADGNTYEINVTYGPEAEIPEGAELKVEEIPEGSDLWEAYRKQTAAALGADDVRLPGLYDITIIFEGQEVEPKAPINVAITLANAEAGNEELNVVHFKEEIPPELVDAAAEQTEVQPLAQEDQINAEHITDTTIDGQTVTFETDRFSIYAFAYTVVVYYKVATGETYRIKLDYDENSGIPAGSVLNVSELKEESAEYQDYLSRTALLLNRNASEFEGVHFFDIEIIKNGIKVEPIGPVSVSVNLDEMPSEEDDVTVLHFQNRGIDLIDSVSVTAEAIQFEAESFSVYAVITRPRVDISGFNGMQASISRLGSYLTNETINSDPKKIGKTSDLSKAAIWYFESSGSNNEYYIFTYVGGVKKYINITASSGNSGNAFLSDNKQPLKVEKYNDSDEYKISGISNGAQYNINLWGSGSSDGFAAYKNFSNPNNDERLILSFGSIDTSNTSRKYAVIVKYNDQYYAVQNDGSLQPVTYDAESNVVEMDYPILWEYISVHAGDGNYGWEPYNLRIATEASGFAGNQLASGYYYRYISPNNAAGTDEETASNNDKKWTNGIRYKTDTHRIVGIQWNNNHFNETTYVGVTQDTDGTLHVSGGKRAYEAAEIYFAEVRSVPQASYGTHDDHTVNHIDIAIEGDSSIRVPVEIGEYTNASGQVIYTATEDNHFINMTGIPIGITTDDIKKAHITAYTKESNGVIRELDNAFFITGYSGNAENGISKQQVRIEGSFKVADLPTVNGADNDYAIRQMRLNHRIYYTVSTVKDVTFTLQYGGQDLYKDGEKVEVTVPVTLSASFDYWDLRNECPALRDSVSGGGSYQRWKEGYIINQGSTMSGMDFVLGANVSANEKPAIRVTKYIQDTDGQLIALEDTQTLDLNIFYNASGDANSVQNRITGFDGTGSLTNDYISIKQKDITVGVNGIGSFTDYDVSAGMIYIQEDEDSIAQKIISADGVEYHYDHTVIETEWTRGDPHHTADGLISVPEVVGSYAGRENAILDFYIYNVYQAKTSITVRKEWTDGNESHNGDKVQVSLIRYKKTGGSSSPTTTGTLNISHDVSGLANLPSGFTATYSYAGQGEGLSSGSGVRTGNYNVVPGTYQVTATVTADGAPTGYTHSLSTNPVTVNVPAGGSGTATFTSTYTTSGSSSGRKTNVVVEHHAYDKVWESKQTTIDRNSQVAITIKRPDTNQVELTYKVNDADKGEVLPYNGHNGYSDNYTETYLISLPDVENCTIKIYQTDWDASAVEIRSVGQGTSNLKQQNRRIAVDPHFLFAATSGVPSGNRDISLLGYEKDIVVETVDLTGANWSAEINNLDIYDDEGNVYYYAIEEGEFEGYSVTYSANYVAANTSGEIVLTATNTPDRPTTGNLTVSKRVTGNAASTTKEFSFTVTARDSSGNPVPNGIYGEVNGMEFTDGTANFTLKHGESKTATGLPDGTEFTVTEDPAGYTPTREGDADGQIEAGTTKSVTFVNELNLTGSIELKKLVEGEGSDQNKDFEFEFAILNSNGVPDTSINEDSLYGLEFRNGVASFTLKHNEVRSIEGIPYGTDYSITEVSEAGYKTALTVNDTPETYPYVGKINSTDKVNVVFTNTKIPTVSVSAEKQWGTTEAAQKATAVQFTLKRKINDADEPTTVEVENNPAILRDANSWKITWNELPKYVDETAEEPVEYIYFVEETSVFFGTIDGDIIPLTGWYEPYMYEVSGDRLAEFNTGASGDTANVIIVNEPEKTNVPVEKTWAEFDADSVYDWNATFRLKWAPLYTNEASPSTPYADYLDNESPVEITINKTQMGKAANGTETAAEYLSRCFTDLPKFGIDDTGLYRILYSVEEVSYQVTENGQIRYSYDSANGYFPSNESYSANVTGFAGLTGSADSDYEIKVLNNKSSNYLPLIVRKEWHDIKDPNNYPEIRFTLYQAPIGLVHEYWPVEGDFEKALKDQAQPYGNYVDIPLNSQNNWTWVCPEELPATNEDSTVRYAYYVVEKTGEWNNNRETLLYQNSTLNANGTIAQAGDLIDASTQTYGRVMIWDYYNNKNSNHAYRNDQQQPQGSDAAILGNNGTLTIVNRATKYIQFDVKKKWLEVYEDGALHTTTSYPHRLKNTFVKIVLMRKTVPANGSINDTLVDWEDYGVPFYIGYDGSGTAKHVDPNNYGLVNTSSWQWQIIDQNNENGLPAYGYLPGENGTFTKVKYYYITREMGVYKNPQEESLGIESDYYWYMALLPQTWGDNDRPEVFPKAVAQDQDRLLNQMASDLLVEKVWENDESMPSDVSEVYVKIKFTIGNASQVYDFTEDIVKRIQVLSNYGFVPISEAGNLKYVSGIGHVLSLTRDKSQILIKGVPLGDTNGWYQYWIEEVGYKDSDGNVYNSTSQFFPEYNQSNSEGEYKEAWNSDPTADKLTLSTKGRNKLRVKNRPTKDIKVEKKWLDENGAELEEPWDDTITSVSFKVKRNDNQYLTFNSGETLTIQATGQRAVVRTSSRGSIDYSVSYVTDSEDNASINDWTALVHGLEKYDINGNEYIYTVEEVTAIPQCETNITGTEELYTITNQKIVTSLEIRKVFNGGTSVTEEQRQNITFTVTGPDGFSQTYTYKTNGDGWKDGVLLINNIPAGTYTVTEAHDDVASIFGNDTNGVLYTHTRTYTVNTVDSEDQAEVIVPEGGRGHVLVTNTYDELHTANLKLTKIVENGTEAELDDEEFNFTVTLTAPEGITLGNSYNTILTKADETEEQGTADPTGTINVILKAGESWQINDLPIGTSYAVAEGELPVGWTLTSSENESGIIETAGTTVEVTFTNTYTEITAKPEGIKTLLNRDWLAGDSFSFTLTPDGEDTLTAIAEGSVKMPEGASSESPYAISKVVTNTENGSSVTFDFGDITFLNAGTYSFIMQETHDEPEDEDDPETQESQEPLEEQAGQIEYATNIVTVSIVVTKNDSTGEMSRTVSYSNNAETEGIDDNEFINTYDTSTKAQVKGLKEVKNSDGWAGYTFTLTGENGSPMPDESGKIATSNEKGEFEFGEITYSMTQVKTDGAKDDEQKVYTAVYSYTVKENLPEGTTVTDEDTEAGYKIINGIRYDLSEKEVTITVTYNESDGSMTATVEPDQAELKFENEQLGRITVTKTVRLNGTETNELGTEFWVGVYSDTEATERVAEPQKITTENGTGSVTFYDLPAGTYYVYELTGENGDPITGTSAVIGEHEYHVTTDNSNAVISKEELFGTASVVNDAYSTNIKVIKVDESTRESETKKYLSGAEFSIEKKDASGNYSAYPNAEQNIATSNQSGILTFDALPDGDYRITENAAPAGYIRTDTKLYFTISEGSVTWTNDSGTEINEQPMVSYESEEKAFTVGNTPGAELPATGGSGTLIYTITGIFLITLAGTLLVARKRKANR